MNAFRVGFLLVLSAAGHSEDASCSTGASLLQFGQNQMVSADAKAAELEDRAVRAEGASGADLVGEEREGEKKVAKHSVLQAQTIVACAVTLCFIAIASQGWLWSWLFGAGPAAESGASRNLLLDNVRVWGVALVIWGHFIWYNLGHDEVVYHDNLTWLKGFEGLGEHVLGFSSVLSLPILCFISGYLSKAPPTEQRIRRYFQCLVVPTLIWVFFCKPVVMELMMNPSMELLRAKMDAMTKLNLFHNEWYLQALCMWRASVFLLWCHLRTPVSFTLMLVLSCAGGYVHFEGALDNLKLEPTLGFLPYFAAGYAFPTDQLHAFASWRSPKTIAAALVFIVAWIELVIPMLAVGELPDGHSSYLSSDTFTSISTDSADHALYWTRRLSKFGLEMVPTIIMIMVVTPHGETSLSWIGPHTIYPFVFHEVALYWRDRLVQGIGMPIITSTSGHVLVLLLHLVWAAAVLALLASPPFRWAFAWCFQPTWIEPIFKALANPIKSGSAHHSRQPAQGDPLQFSGKPSQPSDPSSNFLPLPGAVHSANTVQDPASRRKPFRNPNLSKAVPWMAEARPFYPVLLPLFICTVLTPVAFLWFSQHVMDKGGLAPMLLGAGKLGLPLVWLSCAGVMLVSVLSSLMEAKRLTDALEPSSTQFSGHLKHIVVLLNYKEPLTVLRRTISSIAQASQTHLGGQLTVVLACEARDVGASDSFKALKNEFAEVFEEIMFTQHVLLPGELAGKSSNENFAVREVYKRYVDDLGMDPFQIMLTICDADSIFHPGYFADVEVTFWSHRDGRRFIYTGPLNTYRNLSSGPIITQFYEILRSHCDTWLSVTEPVQPQSNYSLTLGFCEENDFWTPDNTPEDVHTCRKAQFSNLNPRATLKIGSIIVNDLVEDLSDRYVQAKRHRWGITEMAWVFCLYHHMQLRSWLYVMFIEISAGTFAEEAALLSRYIVMVWMATSFWYEVNIYENFQCLLPFITLFIFQWIRFWLEELFLWQKVLYHYPIEKPSLLVWIVLVVLSPVLSILANILFHIVPTIDCLIHVTFFGELFYVNAPKGTAEERLAIQQKQQDAPAIDLPYEVQAPSHSVRCGADVKSFGPSFVETSVKEHVQR
eukprot:TRINITY_DN3078_c0_g2_i3.p1 TRINITY_DN3078_c0_g2~~TRINITY_DN3078_c0_g2_i3.p1  ORF type:complete len:1132 (+),score=179.18 TRINITY_DN3078_c0_g2_i3:81-3398(+)